MTAVQGVRARVITVSDRSARGERADASGPLAVQRLEQAGFTVDVVVIPDGAAGVEVALSEAVVAGARVVITSGGTGLGPRDRTPEGTRPLLSRELPGIAELLRAEGARHTPMAALSRGVAGIIGEDPGAIVVNLPGSVKAVDEGLNVLLPLLPHMLAQLDGSDH